MPTDPTKRSRAYHFNCLLRAMSMHRFQGMMTMGHRTDECSPEVLDSAVLDTCLQRAVVAVKYRWAVPVVSQPLVECTTEGSALSAFDRLC
jgi:hypothetical protein